jgi:hypothetical protein
MNLTGGAGPDGFPRNRARRVTWKVRGRPTRRFALRGGPMRGSPRMACFLTGIGRSVKLAQRIRRLRAPEIHVATPGGRAVKLACCLLAADANPDYLEFFPLVHAAWKDIVGVEVRLVLIADTLPPDLRRFEDSIRVFTPIPGVHTAFQAQCIRVLFPPLLASEFADAVLVSDIDMLPLSRRYFVRSIRHVDRNDFVIYRAGVLEHLGQLPICYNAAMPGTWAEVFPGIRDENDIAALLEEWWAGASLRYGIREGMDWATDQYRLFSYVANWSAINGTGRLVRLGDIATRFRRIDRSDPVKFRKSVTTHRHLLRTGYYADCHMLQPPSEHVTDNLMAATEAGTPASTMDHLRTMLTRIYRMPARYDADRVRRLMLRLRAHR